MPDRIEEIMRKLHIYLENCKESQYSSEDVIVSKKRIYEFLNELNEAVFDVCECYEATKEAKAKALNAVEQEAAGIKQESMERAEHVYAASLLYTENAINSMKNSLEYSYLKVRREYENLINNYNEKINELETNQKALVDELNGMSDNQTYLRIIEDIKKKNEKTDTPIVVQPAEEIHSKIIGEVTSFETLANVPLETTDPNEGALTIEVHETPKMAEISVKGKKKKNGMLNSLFKKVAESTADNDDDDDEDVIVDESVNE